MTIKSVLRFITQWETLQSAVAAYAADLPWIGPHRAALEEALEAVRVSKARQASLEEAGRKARADVNAKVAAGCEAVAKLKSYVLSAFGPRDPRLAAFGIRPLRRIIARLPSEPEKKDGSPGVH